MQTLIPRKIQEDITGRMADFEVVALLGPRQVGKSTLAKMILAEKSDSLYIDLELSSDREKLRDPEAFFEHNRDRLICLDEIQRLPEIFPTLRSIVDKNNRTGQFLILGSASQELIQQSSETLAGRISYIELNPLIINEINEMEDIDDPMALRNQLWLRGGFPKSFLARNNNSSFQWRLDFIRTFLERDISLSGYKTPSITMERLWKMLAHSHGQILNSSKLASSIGLSNHTIRHYIDIFEQTFMVKTLNPYVLNIKKRLVKSPKVYISDSGILHALLDIENFNGLLGHPIYGFSWEGFALNNILCNFPRWQPYFYKTSSGVEIDLILEKGMEKIAIEFKASSSPQLEKGIFIALSDLNIDQGWVIAPIKEDYQFKNLKIVSLKSFISQNK